MGWKKYGGILSFGDDGRRSVSHSSSAAGVRGADAERHMVPVGCEGMGVTWKTA